MKNKNITAKKISNICNAKILAGDPNINIEKYCINTQTIQEGDMFVSINADDYLEEALKKGALGCITQKKISKEWSQKYKDKVILQVGNTIKAIQQIATYKREQYDIPVIGITGSVGKTSTKDMIASVLAQKFKVLKTKGNYNNHIGVPLTILNLNEEHTAMVVEMGMNHLGEIRELTQIAKPNICVITNIGTSHIGLLGSRENILKAKLEIIEGLQPEGKIVINNDNDLLHKWYQASQRKDIITYGYEKKSDYTAYGIGIEDERSTYYIKIREKEYKIEVPISGYHFIQNSLCALTIGEQYGLNIKEIQEGIQKVNLSKKRMEVEQIGKITIINDCYNASYDSMKAAIEYLKQKKGNKKIAILGDMLELGNYAKQLHEKVGEEVVKNDIDILITVGALAKNIALKAAQHMKKENIYSCDTTSQAITKVKEQMQQGDVILLKASNAMRFGEILEGLR